MGDNMSYANSFLQAQGQPCTIKREPNDATSMVSLRRSTKAIRIYGAREAHWEGYILSDSNLVSGDVMTANSSTFLIQSVNNDPAFNTLVWHGVVVNATLGHWRYLSTVDDYGNVIHTWHDMRLGADPIDAFGEIVTAELRQRDPGLLEGTRYIFQVPENAGVKLLDRFVYEGGNYKVDSIDNVGLPGVYRVQASQDTRE